MQFYYKYKYKNKMLKIEGKLKKKLPKNNCKKKKTLKKLKWGGW